MIIQTRRATLDDLDPASGVLADAFADYPWTRWTIDAVDHRRRLAGLQRLALEHVGFVAGHVWVTTVDAAVQSVAIWTDSDASGLTNDEDDLNAEVAALEGDRHEASQAAEREIADWRPTDRHLFLGVIGTSPALQRRGLASMTLGPMLWMADEHGIPCFLETSAESNLRLYAAHGFHVVDHRCIAGGGPDVWAMSRA